MAKESEAQKVKRGVEEGLPKRDYSITIPESANDPGLQAVEDFLNEDDYQERDIVPDYGIEFENAMSVESKNALAVEKAHIDQSIDGKGYLKSLDDALKTMNPKAELHNSAGRKADLDNEAATRDYADNLYQNPINAKESGMATLARMADNERIRANPHLAYIQTLAQADVDLAYKANQLKLMELARDTFDNISGWEKFKAYGGLFIPGNTLKDSYDISGDAFAGEEFFRNFVLNFKKMTPEEQAEMIPVIKKELDETLDNPIKISTVLTAMASPGGENDLEMFSNLWGAFEVAELASFGLSIGVRMANLTKAMNAAKVAKEVENTKQGADIVAGAAIDQRLADVHGLDRVDLTNLGSPFKVDEIDPAYVAGLSDDVKGNLNQFMKDISQFQDKMEGSELFLREGMLDKLDRAKVEKDFLGSIDKSIEEVEVVSRTGTSTTFRYKEGENFTERTLDLSLNDVGQWENKVTSLADSSLFSPTVTAKGTSLTETVAAAQRLDQAQSRVFNKLTEFHRMAVKDILGPAGLKGITPSGRKKLAELDHVLRVGDARREVYTAEELAAGVDGVKLNDKQIGAYFKMRKLVDVMHSARNFEIRKEMQLRGLKHLQVTDDIMETGKPFNSFQDAVVSLSQTRPQEIFDQNLMRGVPLSRIDLEAEYAAGRRLVKVGEASHFQTSADARWKYVLMNAEDIAELPTNVINYRIGYIPKINQNTEYFVKNIVPITEDGIAGRGNKTNTIRVFDNRADAEKFADDVAGQYEGSVRVLEDRQLEKEARALGSGFDESHSLGGSLYTGSRKDEELLFGFDGTPVQSLGAFEAIGRNIANLARFIPRNEWRMGLEQKAINTANAILPETSRVTKFSELAHMPDSQQGRYLKWLHSQIEDWLGFPTREEQLWQSSVQRLYDSALGRKMPDFMKKSVQYVKHKDPVANARAAAFHSLLGWFNPVQLWVQAQGAAVAVSQNILHPTKLAGVMRDNMALAASRYSENPSTIAHVAKAFGMKAGDLAEMQKLWLKSGLEDSILVTADHAAAMQGHGVAMDALSRTANKGLFFYRKGELFNRRTAFTTAYREWLEKNPGGKVDDIALKGIMERTNNFLLNLGKANRAAFQKGIFGIPTQFLQVSTKTMESLLGLNGNFTAAERGKIFMTQLGLYGSAGLGISSIGSRTAASALGYEDQTDIMNRMPQEQRKMLNEGFLGWATLAMFGVDADIGKRSSLLSGVAEFTDRMLFDDTPLMEMVAGAFGSTTNRFWTGFTDTIRPIMYGNASVLDINPIEVAGDMAKTISTWSNIDKVMFMHNLNTLMSRKGKVLRKRDFTAMEELAVAVGFTLSEEKQIYELQSILKDKQRFEGKIVDEIVRTMSQYALHAEDGTLTDDKKKELQEYIALQYQIMPTHQEQLDLRDAVKRRLTQGGDEYSRVWNKFIREFNDGRTADLTSIHNWISSYGIQQKIGDK